MRALLLLVALCAGCVRSPAAPACEGHSTCDDGLFCNGAERCDPADPQADLRGCVPGRSPLPETPDPCLEATCDEVGGSVWLTRSDRCPGRQVACRNATDCEDDTPGDCWTPTCQAGECMATFSPAGSPCDDGAACTVDACDGRGECAATPDHSACADDVFCDGVERCEPDATGADPRGCVNGTPPTAPPGPTCTEARCDELTRSMLRQPTPTCACQRPGLPCADDDPDDCRVAVCTADYACATELAQPGSPCDDDVSCTLGDTCDDSGACGGNPSDDRCDDGLFCNGPEFCHGGCVQGAAPAQSDGLDCTEDRCDEATDRFVHVAGPECQCDVDSDCAPAAPSPCLVHRCGPDRVCVVEPAAAGGPCDDGFACTTGELCDDAGRCSGGVDGGDCDDGQWCTGQERCRPGHPASDALGCLAGTPPAVTDGLDCTDDRCEECDPADPLCTPGRSGRVAHEPTERCECLGDPDCETPSNPCAQSICDPAAWTCRTERREAGVPCEDDLACTIDTTCDASGRCAGGVRDHGVCQDDLWCNGPERCDPERHDAAGPFPPGCAGGVDPRRDHPAARPCARLSCDEDDDVIHVDNSACIDCVDVAVFADVDGDAWGVEDDWRIACLEDDEELEGFARQAGDCVPTDPLRSPGSEDICADFVDDDCDGEDRVCPESQPAAGELPNWDCVLGSAPIMVLAWAFIEEATDEFGPGMCFLFFEAYPGEYFVQPVNVRPHNPDHICPPHPDGTSTNPSLYAHTVVGDPAECPLMEMEINYDVEIVEQPMSSDCRKYVAQMESLGPFAFVSSDLAELTRRLQIASTLELSCNHLTGQEDLPGTRLVSAPIRFNPFFEPF